MAGEWPLRRISDFAEVFSGFAFKSEDFTDFGVPVVKIKNVNNRVVDLSDTEFFSPALITEKHSKFFLKDRDVLIAMTGQGSVGRVGRLRLEDNKQVLLNQRVGKFVTDPNQLDLGYLFYVISTSRYEQILFDAGSGSGQPNLSPSTICSVEIPYPPLPEQKAIAHILGTLDDKIELNRRMNATLEAMARALFQSWFVDFDPVRRNKDEGGGMRDEGIAHSSLIPHPSSLDSLFPAHFQDSPLGPIPQGWRATQLGEVVEIFDSKRIPLSGREREKRRGKYPYYGAASVMDSVDDYLFDGIYLLMGEDGSVINDDGTPVLQYVWGKFWVNNHAHVLQGKNGVCTEHLLLHLRNSNITPFVTGAVQPKLNQGNMNRIEFLLPPSGISKAFARMVEPFFTQIRANTEQSSTLAALRDTLLPKLLSGELRVADINERAHASSGTDG